MCSKWCVMECGEESVVESGVVVGWSFPHVSDERAVLG